MQTERRCRRLQNARDRVAFGHEVEDAAVGVFGFQVVDAHLLIDGFGDVGGRDRLVGRAFAESVGRAVKLTAADAAAGHDDALRMSPMVAAPAGDAAAATVADLRRASHFACHQEQCLVE